MAQRTLLDPRGWSLGTGDKSWSMLPTGKMHTDRVHAHQHTPTHAYAHLHTPTYTHHMYTRAHITYTSMHVHIIYTPMCTDTHVHARVCMCLHLLVCVHMHAPTCTCTHLCTCTQRHLAFSGTKGSLEAGSSGQMVFSAVGAVFLPPAWRGLYSWPAPCPLCPRGDLEEMVLYALRLCRRGPCTCHCPPCPTSMCPEWGQGRDGTKRGGE